MKRKEMSRDQKDAEKLQRRLENLIRENVANRNTQKDLARPLI